MHPAVAFRDVSKSYGAHDALGGISFEIGRGEIVALLGPNGAGKTTALEILLGLRRPTAGTVAIFGGAPGETRSRRTVGATPQNTGFPDTLRVRELLEFVCAHYAHPSAVADLLRGFGLDECAASKVGDLSGGQQRRVAIALAFAGDPELVVLDEPTTGLDVESRRRVWEFVQRSAGSTRTVLFTTHYLEEAEALATRIIVIVEGKIRFDGTPQAFRSVFGRRRVEYTDVEGRRTVVTSADTDAYVRDLIRGGASFRDLLVTQPSFEDIFLEVTGASA